MFPSSLDPSWPRVHDLRLRYRIRREAGIADVHLHGLRHTHASPAVMNVVPIPVVFRPLGHPIFRMALRYALLSDCDIEQATERVGQASAAITGGRGRVGWAYSAVLACRGSGEQRVYWDFRFPAYP